MMSSSSDDKYNQGLGDDDHPCKIRTSSSLITNLPDDCLTLIFKRLTTMYDPLQTIYDRNSFGLTCHQFLHIQNKNCRSLTHYTNRPKPSFDKSIPMVLGKLLNRFQDLQYLSLRGRPKVTVAASKSQFSGSGVSILDLDYCSKYSNTELSLIFSWFPRLVYVSLQDCHITDEGLEALAKCCASLKTVNLSWCHSITDSGISVLIRNCRKLDSLDIGFCSSITGTGFLGCPQTLTCLQANGCKLTSEGIKAIVSSGGLEYLELSESDGSMTMNTEAVLMISIGCPSLRALHVSDFVEVIEPEGWEAIRRNCKNLKKLRLYACNALGDQGWKALMDGCQRIFP